jgi:hypothetical protein
MPSDRVADDRVSDDQVDSVFAGLATELLRLGVDVQIELVERVGVGLGDKDDFRIFVRQSDKGLKNKIPTFVMKFYSKTKLFSIF